MKGTVSQLKKLGDKLLEIFFFNDIVPKCMLNQNYVFLGNLYYTGHFIELFYNKKFYKIIVYRITILFISFLEYFQKFKFIKRCVS